MLTKCLEITGCLVLAASLLFVFCGSLVQGQTIVGFRDSVYLYYPLMQWLNGFAPFHFPLWNPYCNLGMPVVGDGTSCVWYPGRLLFYLPGLSFDSRYGLFLTIHLMLAGCGAYWLARLFLANRPGAMLAAVSYSFGGCVLTQMSNMVYLISAAWLPFALGSIWLMYRQQDFRWSLIAGSCGALIILAGDPQLVYHLGMIATATGCWFWLTNINGPETEIPSPAKPTVKLLRNHRWLTTLWRHLRLLSLFVVATSLLSLAQIYASWDWSQHSQRLSALPIDDIENATPNPQTFHAYQFSLPPWSLTELLWSNASGKSFPVHQRWSEGLPGADRVWYPSIYLGLATFWIAVGQLRFRGRCGNVWLTWIALFFGLGSFGWYGAVWLINEWIPANYRITRWPPEAGGLYWMLHQFLPLYSVFRYPAKLFLVTSLSLSILAGIGLRNKRPLVSARYSIVFMAITSLAAISLATGCWNWFFDRVPADGLFGPFDIDGCRQGLYRSLATSMAIVGVLLLIQNTLLQRKRGAEHRKWPVVAGLWSVVLLTSLDLSLANRWLLAEIPASAMNSEIELPIENHEWAERSAPLSVFRSRDWFFEPQIWSETWGETSSANRLSEVALWQRQTFYPKNHLGSPEFSIRLLGSFSSIWPQQYERLLDHLDAEIYSTDPTAEFSAEPPSKLPRLRQLVNVVIHSDGHKIEIESLDRDQKIVSLHPLNDGGEKDRIPGANRPVDSRIQNQENPLGKIEIESFTCDRIELTVSSPKPCRLVHHCFYDGNWRAIFIHPSRLEEPLLEPLDFGQTIDLHPGTTRLALVYQPSYYRYSVTIMLAAWGLGLIALGFWMARWRKSRRTAIQSCLPPKTRATI